MSKKCKLNISNTCLTRTNAKCVDYEGTLIKLDGLDEDLCHNVEDAIDYLGDEVDDIKEDIDVSGLGCCMTYTVTDEEKGLTVADVLSSHEGMLCDHEERLNEMQDNCCGGAGSGTQEDDCGKPVNSNVSYRESSFGTGSANIDATYNDFKFIPNSSFSDLLYKCEFTGTYKVTVETEADTTSTSIIAGLSKNDFAPDASPFSQTKIEGVMYNTTNFIVQATKNDELKIKYKQGVGSTVVTTVKMIVELIKY